MGVSHSTGGTLSGDDLAPAKRQTAAGNSHRSLLAENPHGQPPDQSYGSITASGNSRLHAGNVYNNYYQPEPSTPRFTTTHEESDTRKTLLRCLSFDNMETRLASIAAAHPATCAWVVNCPQYKRWIDANLQAAHHGCLWIKGKPGVGKSTIMKDLLRRVEAAEAGHKVVSFFFNARGATLEKTTEGMYRSLLFQMAGDLPSPLTNLRHETVELYGKRGWPLELLKDLCRKALRQLASESEVTIFIDALDEGNVEDDVRDMVTFIEELATEASSSGRSLHICLASRHYPTISIVRSELLVLDTLEGHDNDIINYTQAQLRVKTPALRAQLVSAISARASGIFLWVILVVKILNKEADRGNQHRLEAKLQEIPTGLYALFEAILEKDSDQDHNIVSAMIWVLFTRRNLTLVEMCFAIMISTDQLGSGNIVWEPDLVDQTVLDNFLLTSSRGLLEFAEPRTGRSLKLCSRVQVIHESVREYLLMHGLRKLDEGLSQDTEAKCYGRLAEWCAKYIQSTVQFGLFGEDEQARSMRQCPLLEHATEHCLTYAEQAAQQGYQHSMYAETPIKTWRLVAGIRDPHPYVRLPTSTESLAFSEALSIDHMPICTTMLHLFIQQRLPSLAGIELEHNTKRDAKERQIYLDAACICRKTYEGESYRSGCSALGLAVFMKDIHMIRALLHAGADANVYCGRHGSPLTVALRRIWDETGNKYYMYYSNIDLEITHVLIHNGATSPIAKHLEITFPVLRAIETKDWDMVRILMRDTLYGETIISQSQNGAEILTDDLEQSVDRQTITWSGGIADMNDFVTFGNEPEAGSLSDWLSDNFSPPQDHIAEPAVHSRIYHTLWGHLIRQNLPY
jgi:nucleoside-triphosphatase THEP1